MIRGQLIQKHTRSVTGNILCLSRAYSRKRKTQRRYMTSNCSIGVVDELLDRSILTTSTFMNCHQQQLQKASNGRILQMPNHVYAQQLVEKNVHVGFQRQQIAISSVRLNELFHLYSGAMNVDIVRRDDGFLVNSTIVGLTAHENQVLLNIASLYMEEGEYAVIIKNGSTILCVDPCNSSENVIDMPLHPYLFLKSTVVNNGTVCSYEWLQTNLCNHDVSLMWPSDYYKYYESIRNSNHNEFILSATHALNHPDICGFTLLMHYAIRCNLQVVSQLIELGYKLTDVDKFGHDIYYWLSYYKVPERIRSGLGQNSIIHNSIQRCTKLDQLRFCNVIGKGSFGRVVTAVDRISGQYYAVKILRKSDIIKAKQVNHVVNEKQVLSLVNHPFIVKMFGTCQDEHKIYMIMEYVKGGEMFSHLRRVGRFPQDVAKFYAAEILLALEHLHSMDIVYRDLKPENVLLDHQGHAKLTDFGFAKVVKDRTWTHCGTPEYIAPEIILSRGYGKASDYWALGILLYEMVVGYPPFFDETPMGIYEKTLGGKVAYPSFLDLRLKDLIKQLLQPDPMKRLGNLKDGIKDIQNHCWFKGVDWNVVAEKRIAAPIPVHIKEPGDCRYFASSQYNDEEEMSPQIAFVDREYDHLFAEF